MFDKALHYLRRSWVVGQLLTRINFKMQNLKKIWWLFIPLGKPWGISSVLSSPGFLCWVASCSCLACNAEDLGELQVCPSMVSAWSKNLLPLSEVREARRKEGVGSGMKENNLTMFPISAGNI